MHIAFGHLGIASSKFLAVINSGASDPDIDPRMPSVGLFFGFVRNPSLSDRDASRLDTLLNDGTLVIPVVQDTRSFTSFVPTQIANINGISLEECGAEFEALSARVLEGLGLLRERRRLFISYRRNETSNIALQLYEALDAAGFDVFLDTHAVRSGEPFQDVLWHRLADTDVIVVLDSPGFLASRWTEEELARANVAAIQILQILWPGATEVATAAFSTFYPLTSQEFVGKSTTGARARLRGPAVRVIVDAVEGLRARAIAHRRAFLVREFVKEARDAGFLVRSTLDHVLILSRDGGSRILVQAAVGIPDAEGYEFLEQRHQTEARRGATYAVPSVLVYDEKGIRARWLKHLAWLNGNLSRVRSVNLAEARGWLDSLKIGGA
jgi:hypothetical protein